MRSQCAVYVDAGYLLAATATRVTGTSLRSGVEVDHRALIDALVAQAQQDSGLPLLRVNWYDSGTRPGGLPDYVQEQIGLTPRVKLRLGRRSLAGEQKGVDLRIGLDLATHGRQRVVDVIYLVTGDDDLTEAVEEAQSHGVQVSILAVPNHAGRPLAVARHLQRAADGVLLIDGGAIDAAVRTKSIPPELLPHSEGPEPAETAAPEESPVGAEHPSRTPTPDDAGAPTTQDERPRAQPGILDPASANDPATAADGPAPTGPTEQATDPGPAAASPTPKPSVFAAKKPTQVVPPKPSTSAWVAAQPDQATDEITAEDIAHVVHQVVEGWCKLASPQMLAELKQARPTIPSDLDRALLVDLSARAGVYDIPDAARHDLRERFWAVVDKVRLA